MTMIQPIHRHTQTWGRGVRKDCHDCFGIELLVPLSVVPAPPVAQPAPPGLTSDGASQPAGKLDVNLSDENAATNKQSTSKQSEEATSEQSVGASEPAAPQKSKDRNSITYGVANAAEKVLKSMLCWYEGRLDSDPPDFENNPVFEHLGKIIFKKVTRPVPNDLWWSAGEHGDAAQLTDAPTVQLVVSKQYTAWMVQDTIQRREAWLESQTLPLNTAMNDPQRAAFLDHIKAEYRAEPCRKNLQAKIGQKEKKSNEVSIRVGVWRCNVVVAPSNFGN